MSLAPEHAHAVALAQSGIPALLDSMEVVARSNEPGFVGIVHALGDVALVARNDGADEFDPNPCDCQDCDGTGVVTIHSAAYNSMDIDCPWCDGEGEIDDEDQRDSAMAELRFETLNGEIVALNPDARTRAVQRLMTPASERRACTEWMRLARWLHEHTPEAMHHA